MFGRHKKESHVDKVGGSHHQRNGHSQQQGKGRWGNLKDSDFGEFDDLLDSALKKGSANQEQTRLAIQFERTRRDTEALKERPRIDWPGLPG